MTPTGSDTCCLVRPVRVFVIKLCASFVYMSLSPNRVLVHLYFFIYNTVSDLYGGYQRYFMRNKYSVITQVIAGLPCHEDVWETKVRPSLAFRGFPNSRGHHKNKNTLMGLVNGHDHQHCSTTRIGIRAIARDVEETEGRKKKTVNYIYK